jgi:hypothetical protein
MALGKLMVDGFDIQSLQNVRLQSGIGRDGSGVKVNEIPRLMPECHPDVHAFCITERGGRVYRGASFDECPADSWNCNFLGLICSTAFVFFNGHPADNDTSFRRLKAARFLLAHRNGDRS